MRIFRTSCSVVVDSNIQVFKLLFLNDQSVADWCIKSAVLSDALVFSSFALCVLALYTNFNYDSQHSVSWLDIQGTLPTFQKQKVLGWHMPRQRITQSASLI